MPRKTKSAAPKLPELPEASEAPGVPDTPEVSERDQALALKAVRELALGDLPRALTFIQQGVPVPAALASRIVGALDVLGGE